MKPMKNSEIIINNAIEKVSSKLKNLDIDQLHISDYNKRYLNDYKDNLSFFMPIYKNLLEKVLNKLSKPINESTFVDYGGGCGILTFLAIELGFQKVIYNDIYEVSTEDVKIISKEIGLKVDYFVTGDISDFTDFLKQNSLKIDILCSFDVLEHIYDLENWFAKVSEISKPFSIVFMTSANCSNPIVHRKLKKIHHKAEFVGSKKQKGWKERDAILPFFEIRKKIIAENFQNLEDQKIERLATITRGLFGQDILQYAQDALTTNTFKDSISHPTNTCDPFTGNWAEHCIEPNYLKNLIENSTTFVKFTNSFYTYSNNKMLNIPKIIFNFLMKILGKENLFFSPSYTLEVDYKKTSLNA